MKKMIVSALACAMAWAANASINYNIRGTEYVADTIFHAMVGPSTSCTQLLMRSDAGRQMYVRYSITDLTNPYVTFSAVCDLNADGVVNVGDVTTLINLLLD